MGLSFEETGKMRFDRQRVEANVRQASTEDLLDRVTVFAAGMEEDALEIIEAELRSRGVNRDQIAAHGAERARVIIPLADGTAVRCSFCHRPAASQGWGWHRMWGVLPLFPRFYSYCLEHEPAHADEAQPVPIEEE
jgi:hypothetical protein